MGIDITGLGSAAELVTTTIDKIWPDKTEIEKAQLAAAVSIVQGQIDINKEEAKSQSVFVAGWRPSVGWVCSSALAFQFVIHPSAVVIASYFGHTLPATTGIENQLWELLTAMLGIGGMRSFDKLKGVNS